MNYRVVKHVKGAHRVIVTEHETRADAMKEALKWARSNSTGEYVALIDHPGGYRTRYEGARNAIGYVTKVVG